MSHNVETMAYAYKKGANKESYQTPWHGLGVPVIPDISAADMLVKAGLDWTVEKHPTFANIDGQMIPTGKSVLVRSSDKRMLTHTGEKWEHVQNQEFINFYEEYVTAGHMEMNTMGSLKSGEIVWALAKIKESFALYSGRDAVEGYLLFSNPHQYGKAIDIRFTAIRVVCNNTFTLALNNKSDMSVRLNHSRKFDADQVKTALGISHNRLASYKEAAEFLSKKKFTVDNLIAYYSEVFPKNTEDHVEESDPVQRLSRPAQQAYEVLETQPGADFGRGTWWQAFNSVTYATDHILGRSQDSRLTSAWYGVNRQRKIDALTKAVEYAEAS